MMYLYSYNVFVFIQCICIHTMYLYLHNAFVITTGCTPSVQNLSKHYSNRTQFSGVLAAIEILSFKKGGRQFFLVALKSLMHCMSLNAARQCISVQHTAFILKVIHNNIYGLLDILLKHKCINARSKYLSFDHQHCKTVPVQSWIATDNSGKLQYFSHPLPCYNSVLVFPSFHIIVFLSFVFYDICTFSYSMTTVVCRNISAPSPRLQFAIITVPPLVCMVGMVIFPIAQI